MLSYKSREVAAGVSAHVHDSEKSWLGMCRRRIRANHVTAKEKARIYLTMMRTAYSHGSCRSRRELRLVKLLDGTRGLARRYYCSMDMLQIFGYYKKVVNPQSTIDYQRFCAIRPPWLTLYDKKHVDTTACYICTNQRNLFGALKRWLKRLARHELSAVGDRALPAVALSGGHTGASWL